MIIGVDIPEKAEVIVDNEKVYFIFDENNTKKDLWKMSVGVWLTEGNSVEEFFKNPALSSKTLRVSNKNSLRLE